MAERLTANESGRINKAGELVISCQETRSQQRNLALAMERLQEMVNDATVEPKVRKHREGLSKGADRYTTILIISTSSAPLSFSAAKENRIKERKVRSKTKVLHQSLFCILPFIF